MVMPLSSGSAMAASIPIHGGPRELIITYRAQPADRPAFRAYLQTEGVALLRKLKSEGVLTSCQILFNPFVQPSTLDAMTVLNFRRYEDTDRWQKIEKTMPGGLSPVGLKLAKPSATYSADLEWDGEAPQPGPLADHVFYAIPYTYNKADQYRQFVSGYVVPQAEGWIKEGALSRYRFFMNRFPVGDPEPWDSLFLLEYRNLAAFGDRDEVLKKTRIPLSEIPSWKQFNDTKSSIRTESENTVMRHLASC
ncbi:hypothetical protein [Phenylobacterium sp.]|jgi:hypothetical protein|uniref:hypothetical protein n=1 Tax=Phenylobacterium sp. TaxID=1871053 RepID=UPI002F411DBC